MGRWVMFGVAGLVLAACDQEELEVVEYDTGEELAPAVQAISIDDPLGWVRMEGPIELAPVEVTSSTTTPPTWEGINPWTLAEASCLTIDDGAREALLAHPSGHLALVELAACDAPAWCRFAGDRLAGAAEPLRSALGDSARRCVGPTFDLWFTSEASSVEARFQRLLETRSWSPVATSGLADRIVQAGGTDGFAEHVPWLVEQVARNKDDGTFRTELGGAYTRVTGSLRMQVGLGLGLFDDPFAQGAYQEACGTWEGREHWRCNEAWSADLDVSADPEIQDVVDFRAFSGPAALEVWTRTLPADDAARQALIQRLSSCVVEPQGAWNGSLNAACGEVLVGLDVEAARTAARDAGAQPDPSLRADLAALKLGRSSDLIEHLVGLGLLPPAASFDASGPPFLTAARALERHGRAWALPQDITAAGSQELLLRAALQLAGLPVTRVEVDTPSGGASSSLDVWTRTAHYRGSAVTVSAESATEPWVNPDEGGTVAFVNGILAHEGRVERLYLARDLDGSWYVVGPKDGLTTAIEEQLLIGPEMEPATRRAHQEALAKEVELEELDSGSW